MRSSEQDFDLIGLMLDVTGSIDDESDDGIRAHRYKRNADGTISVELIRFGKKYLMTFQHAP
ncbi:MAG: hypothetical protein KDA54_00250 [Phycisphaerales bacterium]|nr:hypothetical protein [Phycisphaerales bacterium]